jgi:transposase
MSVPMAVQKGVRIVCLITLQDAFTRDALNEFLDRVINHFDASPVGKLCIMMDNASIHDPNLPNMLNQEDLTIRFLSLYSSMLNPIQEVIEDVKPLIRTFLSKTLLPDILAIHALPRSQKTAAGRAWLRRALHDALGQITAEQIDQHYAHSKNGDVQKSYAL